MARLLRFRCQAGCTNCCRESGFVYLSEADLDRAAAFLNMSASELERRFVYRTRLLLRLRKPRHGECPFLESWGCRIHPVKPTQCRLFPFWPEIVEDARSWRAAARGCPGIGKGHLVQIGTSLDLAHQMRIAYPSMY